jgi:hypothetical protein
MQERACFIDRASCISCGSVALDEFVERSYHRRILDPPWMTALYTRSSTTAGMGRRVVAAGCEDGCETLAGAPAASTHEPVLRARVRRLRRAGIAGR